MADHHCVLLQCDEARPECQGCVRRGVKCSGYQKTLAFVDVSDQTAEVSRKNEAARWAARRQEDERKARGQPKESQSSMGDTADQFGSGASHSGNTTASKSSPVLSDTSGDNAAGWTFPTTQLINFAFPNESRSRTQSLPSTGAPTPESSALFEDMSVSPADKVALNMAMIKPEVDFDFLEPTLFGQCYEAAACAQTMPTPYSPVHTFDKLVLEDHAFPAENEDFPMLDDLSLSSWSLVNIPSQPSARLRQPRPDVMNDPLAACLLSSGPDSTLYSHFEQTVIKALPVPFRFRHRYVANDCFRMALLALSSANLMRLQSDSQKPFQAVYDEPVTRTYYLSAVRELYAQLMLPDPPQREALAASALLLAYYEMSTGTPRGTMHHTKGVDAILARLHMNNDASLSEIYKAWRLLHYDSQAMTSSYRESSSAAHCDLDAQSMLDPQLAIREIYIKLLHLCKRYTMESCFADPEALDDPSTASDPSTPSESPSEKAARWVAAELNRPSDLRHCANGDYHRAARTRAEILAACEKAAAGLDRWHAALDYQALPHLKPVDSAALTAPGGSSSSPAKSPDIQPVTFADPRCALEYMMYAEARMTCNYLRSVFQPHRHAASITESWARLVLGVVAGLDVAALDVYSTISPVGAMWQAALLCEGVAVLDAMLAVFTRYMLGNGDAAGECAMPSVTVVEYWRLMCAKFAVVREERLQGRALRMVTDAFDEDVEPGKGGNWGKKHRFLAFGDLCGKGPFRKKFTIDWPKKWPQQ